MMALAGELVNLEIKIYEPELITQLRAPRKAAAKGEESQPAGKCWHLLHKF